MSNPILVPLDGSELAEEALPIATELAIRWREPLHLILVHQSPSIFLAPEAGPASLLGLDEEVRRNLKAVRYADERHADLVAIATRGVAGIERAVIGSVADKVVRSAGIPVLVWNPLPGAVSHVLGDGFIAEAEPVAVQPGSARRHKGVR
jgi:nucleotide-binding universal stress UspA family protein